MNQREIAKILGVSVATVSMALRNSDKIRPETKERILEFARSTGYRMNQSARSLSCGKTFTAGIVFSDSRIDFYAQLSSEVNSELIKNNYMGIQLPTSKNTSVQKIFDLLIEHNVDGIITNQQDSNIEAQLEKYNIPLVKYSLWPQEYDSVYIDRHAGMCQTVEHLLSLGHEKIAYAGVLQESEPRYQAYVEVIQKNNIDINPDWLIKGGGYVGDGFEIGKKLRTMKNRPTAICSHNDTMAIGIMNGAINSGIKIPEELSICGCDNIYNGNYSPAPLTTSGVEPKTVAEKLSGMLLKKIENKNSEKIRTVILKPELIIRSSSSVLSK